MNEDFILPAGLPDNLVALTQTGPTDDPGPMALGWSFHDLGAHLDPLDDDLPGLNLSRSGVDATLYCEPAGTQVCETGGQPRGLGGELASAIDSSWFVGPTSQEAISGYILAARLVDPADPNPPDGYKKLATTIGTKTAPTRTGGDVVETDHQCAWYAEDLRRRLAAAGYQTSFTVISHRNTEWTKAREKHFNTQKWIQKHAYTDVHWPDGRITWIEAQLINGRGIDHRYADGHLRLDGNKNGKITYSNGATDEGTDGNARVEVFSSRAAAEKAGRRTDGRKN